MPARVQVPAGKSFTPPASMMKEVVRAWSSMYTEYI